jgi:uncharacterized protein YaaN involved in tellurite resistance
MRRPLPPTRLRQRVVEVDAAAAVRLQPPLQLRTLQQLRQALLRPTLRLAVAAEVDKAVRPPPT